jgi:hypothetical protein
MIRSTKAWAALAVVLLAAPAVSAQPSTADAARALYVEGKALRQSGDLQGSLEKLGAAHALYATPITALELGRGFALVGRLRRAVEVLESIERLPVKPEESAKAAAARAEAKTLLAQYRARVARLVLKVEGGPARVRVDGEVVPGEALGAAWLVDPGPHRVEVEADERRAGEDVRLGEGEERTLTLRLPPPPPPPPPLPTAAPPAPVVPPVAPPAPLPAPRRGPGALAITGFSVGGAGVLLGAITGALTLSRASTLKQVCRSGACLPDADLGTTQTLGDVSTGAFIVGGAGLSLGLGALLLQVAPAPRVTRVEPWIGPAGAGLRGVF